MAGHFFKILTSLTGRFFTPPILTLMRFGKFTGSRADLT